MPTASKTPWAILPLLALLAACDAAPYHEGHAVSALPPPDLSGSLGAPVVIAPAAPISGSSVAPTSLPVRMTAPDLAAAFTNNTAEGVSSTGTSYVAYFAADGSERFRAGGFEDVGRWRILADGRLCTTLPELNAAESCYVIYGNGSTITFGTPDGTALGTVTIVSGDPMGL